MRAKDAVQPLDLPSTPALPPWASDEGLRTTGRGRPGPFRSPASRRRKRRAPGRANDAGSDQAAPRFGKQLSQFTDSW